MPSERRPCLRRVRIEAHDQELERLVRDKVPDLMKSHCISTMIVAVMLILLGNKPERIQPPEQLRYLVD